MKKLLLSLFIAFAALAVNAETTVTFDGVGTTFTSSAGAQSETKDGVTISVGNGLYNNHYRFYKS